MPVAVKSVKQQYVPTPQLLDMMKTFSKMVNDCIKIGLENNTSSMKRLSKLSYKNTGKYNIVNYYRLCAISHAAGILANRKKSIKRGLQPRRPYSKRPFLISCYGFKMIDGILKVPLGHRQYCNVDLNNYVKLVLREDSLQIRSFTITQDSLSICYSKETETYQPRTAIGVDRNLANITIGNRDNVIQYNMSKAIEVVENTRNIIRSFKRNDVPIRKKLYGKYGRRRKNRINQLLHHTSKAVVQSAKENMSAIAFEDIRRIRQLYQRGNGQSRSYRGKMNSWSFAEIKRLITYKAGWEGVPVIQLSVGETRGTSQYCPRCGKKITQVDRKSRQLWCDHCKRWMDRDVVGAMNVSIKGLARFASSQGLAGEAMVQELGSKEPVILRVDASKLSLRKKTRQNLMFLWHPYAA